MYIFWGILINDKHILLQIENTGLMIKVLTYLSISKSLSPLTE